MDIENSFQKTVIHFKSHLDLNAVSTLKNQLNESLQQSKFLILDVQFLSSIDTSGIQLLVNFCITANKNGITWQWTKPPEILIATAKILGAEELLKLNTVETS